MKKSELLGNISTIKLKQWVGVSIGNYQLCFQRMQWNYTTVQKLEQAYSLGVITEHLNILYNLALQRCVIVQFFYNFGVVYIVSFLYNLVLVELCGASSLVI